MNEERIQRIREHYLKDSDRAEIEPSPVFAGRDKVIEQVLSSVERLTHSPTPRPNLSTVLYGAPGSGKTETMTQIRRRLERMSTPEHPIAVIDAGRDTISEAEAFAADLEEQIDANPDNPLRYILDRGGSIGIAGLFQGSIGPKSRDPSSELARMKRLARTIRMTGNNPTIVLMIDEAQQKLNDARDANVRTFAMPFHMGETALKVLPIYAGLGNTPDELARVGVSRLRKGTRHLMRRLSDEYIAGMATEALHAMTGQDDETVQVWSEAIMDKTQGWPMHLNHILGAVAQRAHATWWLDDHEFGKALQDAGRERSQYYGDRLKACRMLKPEMFTAWAGMLKDGRPVTEWDVAEALELSKQDAEALVTQAVKAGLIEPERSMYIAPIPSMVDHIAREGEQHVGVRR